MIDPAAGKSFLLGLAVGVITLVVFITLAIIV